MVDTAQCTSYVGARRLRVTKLDRCGKPITNQNGSYAVSSGFVSVEIGTEVEEGDDYTQKNAGGDLCVSDKGQDNVKWLTVSIEFCRVDPALFQLMNPTWKLVTNGKGEATGFRIGQKMSDQDGFALELWPKISGSSAGCDDDEDGNQSEGDEFYELTPSGYFLLPYVLGTAPDSWTLENGTATFTLTGRTKAPSQWGTGPWAVTRDENGEPSQLLVPIENGSGNSGLPAPDGEYDVDHFHADVVTVAPPPTSCGAQDLRKPRFSTISTDGGEVTVNISNFAQIQDPAETNPRPVVIYWGDGEYEQVESESVTHTYSDADNATFTIKLLAYNGAIATREVTTKPANDGGSQTRTVSSLAA